MDQTDDASTAPVARAIVAIGASAGGLEPLEQFFAAAPGDAGWCFIVIQHLSPDYRSMMDQLLARKSAVEIRHIDDGVVLEPNRIYLNRPNCSVQVLDGVFRTTDYAETDQLPRNPIDILFRSLITRDPGETVGVVMSGSGSDGARGAAELHDAGATILVQDPNEAGFPSMPQAVLSAGTVDRILPAAAMPDAIRDVFKEGRYANRPTTPQAEDALRQIYRLLEAGFHTDFSAYKKASIYRRILRRQHLRGIESVREYADMLAKSPMALEELYHDLLIGVTEFYRDPEAFVRLREKALDQIIAASGRDEAPVRVWVPGCASGEEAYTVAMELSEALAAAGSSRRFRVIATDVHRRSLDTASSGYYPEEAVAKLPDELRARYFRPHRDGFIVEPALRQKIIFSAHDVLADPPFMHLDLISCRNLFIYLNSQAQSRVLSMFLFGLRTDGYLLLGPSESIGKYEQEFATVDHHARLYRKATSAQNLSDALLTQPMRKAFRPEPIRPDLRAPKRRSLADEDVAELRNRDTLIRSYNALLKRYAPASILVTAEGVVLSWFGEAEAFIDTMNNLADWMVEDIVHPDLHFTINVGMEKLRQGQTEGYVRRVAIESGDTTLHFRVKVEPLDEVGRTRIMLVSLTPEDAPAAPPDEASAEDAPAGEDVRLMTGRVHELERDLRLTEETLQHVTERLEASGEELQAANEELQASNEELQAANEELQGSNEELHAVNEELISVTDEHERKIELLSELNRNTDQVLSLLEVGVMAVDGRGMIQRFSDLVARRFLFQTHDVGRPISVVAPRLDFVDLPEAASRVIAGGKPEIYDGALEGEPLRVEVHRTPKPDIAPDGKPVPGAIVLFRGLRVPGEPA